MINSKIIPQELQVAESLDKRCVLYLHVATMKYLTEAILNGKGWYWLMVSENSIHHVDGGKQEQHSACHGDKETEKGECAHLRVFSLCLL